MNLLNNMIKVNKPLTIIGIILLIMGGVGTYFFIEFWLAIIFGITLVVVGIAVSSGRFSKRAIADNSAIEFCPHCGSSIKKGSKFCGYCSGKL